MVGRLFYQPGDVFPDHVEFKVHFATRRDRIYIGVFEGIGDDGDGEMFFPGIEDRQANAVEADRAFFDDQPAEFPGKSETEFPAASQFFCDPEQVATGSVDMTPERYGRRASRS